MKVPPLEELQKKLLFRRRKKFSRAYMRSCRTKHIVYEFEGSAATLCLKDDPKDLQEKLRLVPNQLPKGIFFEDFQPTGHELIDFFALNVRHWILDFLNAEPLDRWEIDDLAKYLLNFGISERFEDFLFDLNSLSSIHVALHFRQSFSELLESQINHERAKIDRLRGYFNKTIKSGAERLTDLEIRLLSGIVAATGYLEGLVDTNNLDFIESIDISHFLKSHYCSVSLGEQERAMSPFGNLFSSFLIDVEDSRQNGYWRQSSLILGNVILENLPCSVTTSGLRKIQRGYEIKTENLPDLEEVILEQEIKEKLIRLIDFYKFQSMAGQKASLKILLRGVPGAGKTLLSQAIAKRMDSGLLAVNLSSTKAGNNFYLLATFIERAKQNNLVLALEECEQLLSVNPYTDSRDDTAKLMFEDHEGIAIFTTNIETAETWFAPTEAIERRMDLIIDFQIPGPEHREKILTQEINKWLSQGWISDLTQEDIKSLAREINISGGFYPQALKQAASFNLKEKNIQYQNLRDSLKYVAEKSKVSQRIEEAISSEIKLSQVVLSEKERSALEQIIQYARTHVIQKSKNPILPQGVTILFSGPSGTGKSMTAQALANELDMKVRITSASDFLSMFVGGTEKNIRKHFFTAENKKEILFIDEAEGLFHSRDISQRSWETTQVNELLKATEQFKGILICATNHPEMLDHAFARRFLFNVKFSVPDRIQRAALWRQHLSELKIEDSLIERTAERFELSGGEIRNIAVQVHISGVKTWQEIEALCLDAQASRTGNQQKRRIGIV